MIYILLILASFIWGMNVLVMKQILEVVPTYFLAMLKVGLSLLSVLIIMKIKKVPFSKIEYKPVILVSIFALTINFLFTFTGMEQMSGANNAIMNALAPMITIVLSYIFISRNINKKQLLAMLLSILGFFISIEFQIDNITMGHGLLFLGIISYCYANIVMQKSRSADNYFMFTLAYLFFGFIELLTLSIVMEPNAVQTLSSITWVSWILFFLFSGIGFAYIQVIYMYAIKKIGSIKTSFFLSLNPVFTYLGAILFLQEEIEFFKVISFIILLLSLAIANYHRENIRKEK